MAQTTDALTAALEKLDKGGLLPDRKAHINDALRACMRRMGLQFDEVLAGGSESVVVACSLEGKKAVLKATRDPAEAIAEARLFSAIASSPRVLDLDTVGGVIAMEHIEGVPLVQQRIGDPETEWGAVSELVTEVNDADLDTAGLLSFPSAAASRLAVFTHACHEAGREDLLSYGALLSATLPGSLRFTALDIHPKNIIVTPTGRWMLIDPMATLHNPAWCFAKWAIVRRNPGGLAGTSLMTWLPFLKRADTDQRDSHSAAELVVTNMVWEVGSQRTSAKATRLLPVLDSVVAQLETDSRCGPYRPATMSRCR
jgi:hypothetical protein